MKSQHYEKIINQLKSEDAQLQASAETRNALLKALRAPKTDRNVWMKIAAVFLLSIFCSALWILKTEPRSKTRPEKNTDQVESYNDYLPLTYGLTPEESLQTVRVKLPRSALNDFGISVNKIRSEEVTADLLVGESGLPYAIRVVQQN